MKDGLDPVYKGAKAGFFAMHSISTWKRQEEEGKMECDHKGWMGLTGVLTFAGLGVGYGIATTTAVAMIGPIGFSVLGIPIATQAGSYIIESYKKAKQSVLEEVVMTKVQGTINKRDSEGYDVTCKQMIDTLTDHFQKETLERHNLDHDLDKDELKEKQSVLEKYETNSRCRAKQALADFASEIFKGLYADKKLGRKYEMSQTLMVGPRKHMEDRRTRPNHHNHDETNMMLSKMISQAVSQNDGEANIELLGKVKAVYSGGQQQKMHYKVIPNELWKR